MSSKFHKRGLASTASILASAGLFLVGAPAFAQETVPAPAAEPAGSDVVITVTGIRGALLNAQNIKRRSATVVEVVALEDIGDFADASIADALQRVPGVQITRGDDGRNGDIISVRGLGNEFVTVTLNGRIPPSGGNGGRSFLTEVIPSELLQEIAVYKQSTAENIESGIGGLVALQTIKPLDYKSEDSFFGFASARGEYDQTISEETSPRYSGLVGWQSPNKKLGAYVGASYADIKTARYYLGTSAFSGEQSPIAIDFNGDGEINDQFGSAGFELIEDARFPTFERARFDNQDTRVSVTTATQWRPSPDWELGVDYLYSKNERRNQRRDTDFVFFPGNSVYSPIPEGVFFTPDSIRFEENAVGQNEVLSVDFSGLRQRVVNPSTGLEEVVPYTDITPALWIYGADGEDDQLLHSGGAYAKFENDQWMARIDASYSFSRRETIARSTNFGQANFANPGDLTFNTTEEGLPTYRIRPGSATNELFGPIRTFDFGGPFNGTRFVNFGYAGTPFARLEQEQFALKFDGARRLDGVLGIDDFALKFGARYTSTLQSNRLAVVVQNFDDLDRAALAEFAGATLETNDLDGAPLILGNVDRLYALFPQFRADPPESILNRSLGTLPAPSGTVFASTTQDQQDVEEQTLALYWQFDFADQIGSLPFSGNIGVRSVRDTVTGTGGSTLAVSYAPQFTGVVLLNEIREQTNEQWVHLPSINFAVQPTDFIQVRLGISRSLTRPPFGSLVPNDTVTIGPRGGNFLTASGSNIALSPYTAWNYDLTAEFYTPNDGAIYASLFYKDVNGFIVNETNFNVPASQLSGTIAANIAAIPGLAAAIAANCSTGVGCFSGNGAEVLNDPRFQNLSVVDQVDVPFNAGEGSVYGIELGFNQPFTFLPSLLKYTGLQASYTFVETELATGFLGEAFGFAGTARNQITTVGYYEAGPLALRVAYNYRGETELGGGLRQERENLVDATLSYEVTPWLELSVEGRNLTEQDRRNYFVEELFLRDYITRPRVITFGARANF